LNTKDTSPSGEAMPLILKTKTKLNDDDGDGGDNDDDYYYGNKKAVTLLWNQQVNKDPFLTLGRTS
jgi:hypothetical protein